MDYAAITPKSGKDGRDIEGEVHEYLDFLRRVCAELGIPDPVEQYFAPVVGRWSDLHAEAARWAVAGALADRVTEDLTNPLGGLDAAWQGAGAESFIDYMNTVGLAGRDLADAAVAMAEVLDTTADGVREIVAELAGVLAEAAVTASEAVALPMAGEERTRQYLDDLHRPTKELFDAVRQVLEAMVRMCEGVDGSSAFDRVSMAHAMPAANWSYEAPKVDVGPPAGTEPAKADALKAGGFGGGGGGGAGHFGGGGGGVGGASAGHSSPLQPGDAVYAGEALGGKETAHAASGGGGGGASGGGRSGGGMMGGMPMGMGGMGGQQGGDNEHKSRNRVVGDPEDIFGKPAKASPSVIGDD